MIFYMKVYTVYKTTNTINGHFYIGVHKTDNPNDSYLGSGVIIKEAIREYGRPAFVKEVLFTFETLEEAYAKEKELVNAEFVARRDTYNVTEGGTKTVDWVEDRLILHRERVSGENHPFYGKTHSDETKARISASLKAKPNKRTKESYEQQAEKRRGQPSKLKGSTQTAESNAKRSASHLLIEKVTCPHCGALTDPGNARRWHFDRCKKKPACSE